MSSGVGLLVSSSRCRLLASCSRDATDPLGLAGRPRGRALGVRRRPRRHRRDAARPRAAPYLPGDDRRVAAARRARAAPCSRARRPRWPRCATARATRSPRTRVRVSHRAARRWRRLLGPRPLQAFARHPRARGRRARPDEPGPPARRGVRRPAPRRRASCCSPTTAPALLVAAVVHAELATAAPFASHNGIVARAAERLVLVARGVDAKSLVVPEAGHLALRAAYESNLRRLPRRRAARACTPGCSTPPRRTPRAPRRARCGDGRGAAEPRSMRAAPDS